MRAKRTLDRKKGRCHALKKEHGTEPSYEDEPRTKPRTEQNPVLDFSPQLLGHNSGIDVLLWLCFCFRGGSLALSCNLTDMFYTGTSIRFRDFPGRLPEVSDVAVIDNVSSRLDWRTRGQGCEHRSRITWHTVPPGLNWAMRWYSAVEDICDL